MNILIYSVVALLVLVAILTLQNTYDDNGLLTSVTRIQELQAGTLRSTQNFFKFTSNYFMKLVIVLPIFVPYYMVSQRARSFYYVLLLSTTMVITNYMKLLLIQARPFWVSPDVQAFDCQGDYGNPGMNMTYVTAITIAAFFDYNASQQAIPVEERTNWVLRSMILLITAAFCGLVGYSTFFTGANSSN